MDRPVSKEHKRKILIRQSGFISVIIIVPLIIILFLKRVFIPSVSLSQVTTAVSRKRSGRDHSTGIWYFYTGL